jgi:hypothetical protein
MTLAAASSGGNGGPAQQIGVGAWVLLKNAVTHPNFNGLTGTVTEQSEDGRWHIRLGGKARGFHLRYVKESNLDLMPVPPPRSLDEEIEADV